MNGIPASSKKTDLLKLPEAEWGNEGWYDSLLIVPTRRLHDSGWAHIAIIGVNGDTAEAILGYPDDIALPVTGHWYEMVRVDCYPSGVLRMWSSEHRFTANGVSSLTIKVKGRKS